MGGLDDLIRAEDPDEDVHVFLPEDTLPQPSFKTMRGGPLSASQHAPLAGTDEACAVEACISPSSAENSGALANMATPEGPPSNSLGPPKGRSPATPDDPPPGEGGPPTTEGKGRGPSRTARSSSSSVISLMSEDGEEEASPSFGSEGLSLAASRPKRAAAARSKKAGADATAAAATPPPVLAKYREELQQVDADIALILRNGLPSTDLLSSREAYLKAKQELEVPEGEDEMEGEGEQPLGTGLALRLQRLLRVLCEASPLPLSALVEAARAALADGGPQGEAPVFSVDAQTLKVELPVLLTRRRFGLARPIDPEGTPAEAPRGAPVGPLEDVAPFKLWAWECVLLDGLPAAFREAARRDREARQTLNRRLRALEKLRETLLSGVEADIAAARERVRQQLQREAAAAERKQQQENKRRQLEYARKERERERRQREEQKRQRDADRERRDREKQEEREKKEKEKEEQRLQKLQQQAEKQKEKKADPSVNRQQSLMASWLRRPAASSALGTSPAGGPSGALVGAPPASASAAAAGAAGEEEQNGNGIVIVLDEDQQQVLNERLEVSRAAETEAAAWKAAPEDKKEFVELVEALAQCAMQRHRPLDSKDLPQLSDSLQQQADPSSLLQQFVEKHAAPARASLRAFVSFCAAHRRFVHKVTVQQPGGAPPDGDSSSSSSSSSNSGCCRGGGYWQAAAEVRKGLTLTDYCAESLPDAPFLRMAWVALDEWKRPVRRLLMAKLPKAATSCEQWAEESCVDYERDSDDEWFECFDADDLEDAKEEEEEEEVEGEDDRDWLEEDEEGKEKLVAAPTIRFESFLQWSFTFDGEAKPNEADFSTPLTAIPSLRDGSWCSAYGCAGDDWGGNPLSRLDALPVHSRRKWSDEDSVNLLRFFHGKTIGKLKGIPEFQKANRHVTKAEVERQLKQCMVYERRPEDRQRRWYATEEAARAFNLVNELEEILQVIRAEEKVAEAKQQELAEQLRAQLTANNVLFDCEEKKQSPCGRGAASPRAAGGAAASSSSPTSAAADPPAAKGGEVGAAAVSAASGCSKVHPFFVKKLEDALHVQEQQVGKAAEAASTCGGGRDRSTGDTQQMQWEGRPSGGLSAEGTRWPGQADTASAMAAADIAERSAAAAAAAAAAAKIPDALATPQDAALAAHVAAAALLAAKLARGAAGLEGKGEAAAPLGSGLVSADNGHGVSRQLSTACAHCPTPVESCCTAVRRKSAQDRQQFSDKAEAAAATPADASGDVDQISAGKRMRKSAASQGSPVDSVRDSATKRTGLALLTVIGACFCIASHFFFQSSPPSHHSTFRDADWGPSCMQWQSREHKKPPLSGRRIDPVAPRDGGKFEDKPVSPIRQTLLPDFQPSFAGPLEAFGALSEESLPVGKSREAEALLPQANRLAGETHSYRSDYGAACSAAWQGGQEPMATYTPVGRWNDSDQQTRNRLHAAAAVQQPPSPDVVALHADPLQRFAQARPSICGATNVFSHNERPRLECHASLLLQTDSPELATRSGAGLAYPTQEIAELSRVADAIESLLGSSGKRKSRGEAEGFEQLSSKSASSESVCVAPNPRALHLFAGSRLSAAETVPSYTAGGAPPAQASPDKPEQALPIEGSEMPCPPAKRSFGALEPNPRAPQGGSGSSEAGSRLRGEVAKKPRIGVMTNVLLLVSRRNAGSLSPDQCASATANYFSAKKDGPAADYETSLDAVRQLQPIFCPSALPLTLHLSVSCFFELNLLSDLLCEADLVSLESHLMGGRRIMSLKLDGQMLLKAAICERRGFASAFVRLLHSVALQVSRRQNQDLTFLNSSSRIRLTKSEQQTEKEGRKEGTDQVEYGSSWQPLLVRHLPSFELGGTHTHVSPLQNELRASSELQKSHCEDRAAPSKRRSSEAETDADHAPPPSNQRFGQDATRAAVNEACKHEGSLCSATKRSSKENGAATPAASHNGSSKAQHNIRAARTSQQKQEMHAVKPENTHPPLDKTQHASEERSKRQRKANDSTSTMASSTRSLQEECRNPLEAASAALNQTGAAAGREETSEQSAATEASKDARSTCLTPAPSQQHQLSTQDSAAAKQAENAAPLNGRQPNRQQESNHQQNAQRKAATASAEAPAQQVKRRYNTRSTGVVKKEG
ncbi:hypothetical protein Efla_001232 [Eimeria flavescens]